MLSRLKRILIRILLFPIMPAIMWGPFTHPYIARKVYEKAEQKPEDIEIKEIDQAISKNREYFIFAANSPDCIATNHLLYNRIIYDYAHNCIPNKSDGSPVFGYRLVHTALEKVKNASSELEKGKYERQLAFACGWLTHQLSDYIAHYTEVDGFNGYANSHQIIGSKFYPDILRKKESVEHGIIELYHDINIYENLDKKNIILGYNHVELPIDEDNLITEVSRSFEGFSNIPYKHIPTLKDNFNLVINGMESLILLLKHIQPDFIEEAVEFVDTELHQSYLMNAIDFVYENLFMLDAEKLAERIEYNFAEDDYTGSVEIIPDKKESIIHTVAFKVGEIAKPESISSLLRNGYIFRTKILWKRIDVPFKSDILLRLKSLLLNLAENLSNKSEEGRSIKNYLFTLMKKNTNMLHGASNAYCSGLRPIAYLDVYDDELKNKTTEEILKEMIYKKIIKLRFTPAVRKDKNTYKYKLNPDTVNIHINGYYSGDPGASFELKQVESEDDLLCYELILEENFAKNNPVMQLFADIEDFREEHSEYIDYQVKL